MPKAERLPVVKALREEGHSLRAIAGAIGVSKSQVERDLSGVPLGTPLATTGLDGKSYPARKTPKLPESDVVAQSRELYRERREQRQLQQEELGRGSVPLADVTAGTFRVIYADPPWRYDQTGLVSKDWGMVEDKYPTMSLAELHELPVADLTTDDAVLFLWATSPLLADAVDLMRHWGFAYKSSIVWDKGRPYLGYYVHVSHELLLIGTRGSCTADVKHTAGSVFAVPRGEHSRKPDEFRALIDSMYTYGNRIELFRRGDAPAGWHVWGNEARDG